MGGVTTHTWVSISNSLSACSSPTIADEGGMALSTELRKPRARVLTHGERWSQRLQRPATSSSVNDTRDEDVAVVELAVVGAAAAMIWPRKAATLGIETASSGARHALKALAGILDDWSGFLETCWTSCLASFCMPRQLSLSRAAENDDATSTIAGMTAHGSMLINSKHCVASICTAVCDPFRRSRATSQEAAHMYRTC